MIREILVAFAVCATVVSAKDCKVCIDVIKKPVCGVDGVTYESFCDLERAECVLDKPLGFQCDGVCPCDPEELKRMDALTVQKLANLRSDLQVEQHLKEEKEKEKNKEINFSENIVNFAIPVLSNEDKDLLQNQELYGCLPAERVQLPRRLIDWFHVLKTNEREQENREQGFVSEPVLKEMTFIDAKLKAMYADLACADNDAEVEKEVCLSPVKWMFKHMDSNSDHHLSATELLEIEEINSEHCIKPFLKSCDRNNNANVTLKEFCKCLCVTPPCTHALQSVPTVLMGKQPKPMPGLFVPKCDEDGFFMPMQHNEKHGEYWCVNRNGAEIRGSRTNAKIACPINTMVSSEVDRNMLIPLDMKKENEPVRSVPINTN